MSKAAVTAKKAAKKADNFQRRIEESALLDVVIIRCDDCHMPIVSKRDTPCVCGSETGTFDSYPTIALAEYLTVH